MNSLIHSLLITAALAASTGVTFAQGAQKVAFRTLCLEHVGGITTIVVPGPKAEDSQSLELYSDMSPVADAVFPGGEAQFFVEKPGADGTPARELVGKTTLGKSNRQLFVFLPGKSNGIDLPYLVRAYDDDTTAFAMGSVRAINSSPVPIRFVLSGAITPQIPPGKYAMFPHSKKVNEYNMYPVVVEFLGAGGKWIKGQSVSWKATDKRREIVIASVDTRFKQPVVRVFSDFPPWLEELPVDRQP